MSNNMHLDDTLVGVAQRAYLERAAVQSCKPRKKEVKGEVYVSREPSRQNKIGNARNAILTLATVVVFTAGLKVVGDSELSGEIMEEVTRKETTMDSRGMYVNDYARDEGFIDAMIDLNDGSLVKLFNETSKEMVEDGEIKGTRVLSEVVDEMEDDYIREHGKSR